jgi:hypothetical protein
VHLGLLEQPGSHTFESLEMGTFEECRNGVQLHMAPGSNAQGFGDVTVLQSGVALRATAYCLPDQFDHPVMEAG